MQWESRKESADRTGQKGRECGGDGGQGHADLLKTLSYQEEVGGRFRGNLEEDCSKTKTPSKSTVQSGWLSNLDAFLVTKCVPSTGYCKPLDTESWL